MKSIIILVSFLLFGCACSNKKDTARANIEVDNFAKKEQGLLKQDFIKGIIVYSDKPNDCEYTIKMEGNNAYYLDPMVLNDSLKKDGLPIYFKFNGLRRQNRCNKANPIKLLEVKFIE